MTDHADGDATVAQRPGSGLGHIGILAHSLEGAALCLTEVGRYASAQLGANRHPDITLDYISFAAAMPAYERGDLAAVRRIMLTSVGRLAQTGAYFFACPDNTVHLALEAPGPPLALPGLHIAEVAAEEGARCGFRRVGLLGTRFTMAGPLYPAALGRLGIESVVPTAEDQAAVDRIIFDELVHGVTTHDSLRSIRQVIARLGRQGCDAVVLACTELPLLIPPAASSLPTLDTTRLLAQAAVEVAAGMRPFPSWVGGPRP